MGVCISNRPAGTVVWKCTCLCDRKGKKAQNVLRCEHRCELFVCVHLYKQVCLWNWYMIDTCMYCYTGWQGFFLYQYEIETRVFWGLVKKCTCGWWLPIRRLWLSYWTTVGSHCVTADTNPLSSIGCGEECRRRCLVSVADYSFVSQCACSVVCVYNLIYCYSLYLSVHV